MNNYRLVDQSENSAVQMVMRMQRLVEETIDEHICERYIELAARTESLKQDLGIVDAAAKVVSVDIEPPFEKRRKAGRGINRGDRYNLEIGQSITSLRSSRDNGNSTTGYVLWSTTPFFLRWLLYDVQASAFRDGGNVNDVVVPALLSPEVAVLELGGGTSGILPVVLGNYVGTYVCSDQRGLMNGMKANIRENLLQLNKRRCVSRSLGLEDPGDEDVKPRVRLEVLPLDWETFQIPAGELPFELKLVSECSTVYIVAMDVIYNDYLIEPFLDTLSGLWRFYKDLGSDVHSLIGVHMRAQEVASDFLEKAVIEYGLPVHYIQSESVEASRFGLYYI